MKRKFFGIRRAVLAGGAAMLLTSGSTCSRAQQTLAPPADAGGPITIRVDVAVRRHPISPLVYGVSYAGENAAALHCPINRMGGNNTSRYNWRENADNRANDYFFESIADSDKTPGGRTLDFVRANRKAHTASMVTVPILGWVARVNPDRSKRWSFSVAKYGAQQKTDAQWSPDSGNGVKADGSPLTGNDPRDANIAVTPAYMQPWIAQLTQTFGRAAAGGVDYYLLDNEPAIWNGTHRDVFPVGVKMDDLFARMRDTSRMIKGVDPTALTVGPEEWGWTGFLYSGYDSQWGGAHHWQGGSPDRDAHGGQEMMPWLLAQFAREEKTGGKRLLDVFSLHYYPQGGEFGDDLSPQVQLRRNRSTRSLWDPAYVDETWIKEKVRLVPRMREWVDKYYPGTKIALTEYSWGAEGNINGATAEADVLGILGREGMDIANRWTSPGASTPTFKAMQLYRNYDGRNGGFGDTSVACDVPDPDAVSAFAAQDGVAGALTVMIVAKTPGVAPTPVTLSLAHFPGAKAGRVYQLTAANTITRGPDLAVTAGNAKLTVPPQSITLVVLAP